MFITGDDEDSPVQRPWVLHRQSHRRTFILFNWLAYGSRQEYTEYNDIAVTSLTRERVIDYMLFQ